MVDAPPPTLTFSLWRHGAAAGSVAIARPIIKIGRDKKAHLLLDAPGVERMHAVIEVAGDEIVLIDLGSDGGTRVNGTRINKASLDPGDVVGIGPFEARLDAVSAAPVRQAVSPPPRPEPPPPRPEPPRPVAVQVAPVCARCSERLGDAPLGKGGHAYRDLPIRALRCSACAITYVDVATLEQQLRRRVRLTGTAAERSRKRGGGQCPLCRTSLERVVLEWAGSWATVEECPACGLLALEEGELAVIERLANLAAGG